MTKRVYSKFWFILFLILFSWTTAQDYQKLGSEICESISTNKSVSKESILKEFEKYYQSNVEKDDLLISDANVFLFNLQKELIKNCSTELPIFDSFLMLFSTIADTEKIFNNAQIQSLEKLLKEIKYKKRLQILIISTDDFFPHQNIGDYAFETLDANYNPAFENGGIIFVINTNERSIQITTNLPARKIIKDELSQNLIDQIIIPNFKNEKYFGGIQQAILKIQSEAP